MWLWILIAVAVLALVLVAVAASRRRAPSGGRDGPLQGEPAAQGEAREQALQASPDAAFEENFQWVYRDPESESGWERATVKWFNPSMDSAVSRAAQAPSLSTPAKRPCGRPASRNCGLGKSCRCAMAGTRKSWWLWNCARMVWRRPRSRGPGGDEATCCP